MSERTKELKKKIIVKAFRPIQRGFEKSDTMKTPYRDGVILCVERARYLTQSYKETEGQPMVLRRAKALSNILQNMSIYISENERIVGNYASTPEALTTHSEFYWRWLDKAIRPGKPYAGLLDDNAREELLEINQYWGNKSVHGMERDMVPERVKPYWKFNGAFFWMHGAEAGVPDFEKIFSIGLNGIIEEAKARLIEIGDDMTMPSEEFMTQKTFLEATIIALQAAIDWGKRFSELAKKQANDEKDSNRKKELEQISEICERVPGNPPRTFYEALQSFWFVHIIQHLIEQHQNGCSLRFDQLLYPFYSSDKKAGRITREGAQELLEFVWIKMEELGIVMPPLIGGGLAGNTLWQTVTIGGVTKDGQDATNEMSYIILDSCNEMRMIQPSLALRYHPKIDPEFIMKAIDLIKSGVGYPAFFNDNAVIPMLLRNGIPIEKAREYGIEGCMRFAIPGESMVHRALVGVMILPKCLEIALNEGVDKTTGKLIGKKTAVPLTFKSADDVLEAFLEQVEFYVDKQVVLNDTADLLYRKYVPRPFLSGLLKGCIENGRDCREYSFYHKSLIGDVGGIDVANSLAAIQKLIFDDKVVSMEELIQSLQNNWEGAEERRQMFLNAPKYGNDDDYVDDFAKKVYYGISERTRKYKNIFGDRYDYDGSSSSMYYGYSGLTNATPDGRKDGDNFSDGTISPKPGTDLNGPTAVLKSASKIDPILSHNQLLNQKFQPMFLEGVKKSLFASYLKTWAELGIHHIQFNIVNKETLIDAQKHPEEYTDLIVRVAGYSAYYIDLDKDLQDDIIRRTEQSI